MIFPIYGSALFVVGLVWIYQFIQLMLLSEGDFPARHDKIVWATAFIVIFPFAPFAFIFWKRAYLSMREKLMREGRPANL
jgi:hypothetical protein